MPANETAAASAAAGNVGTGALTLSATAPIAASAINGRYQVILRATGATASYEVIDPKGVTVGEGNVAGTFNNQLKFVLANAGTMTIGDTWYIDVIRESPGDETWDALTLADTTGLAVAAGVLFAPVIAGAGTVKAAAIVRQAQVRAADLTWPSGATVSQIAVATQQLRDRGIICR